MTFAEAAGLGAALGLGSRLLMLAVYRPWFRQGPVGDSSIHWVIVRTLRRRPRARWIDEYVISPEPMSYPTGFHRFAALFPLDLVRTHPWLPNLVLWTAGVAGYAAYLDFAARSLLRAPVVATASLGLALVLVVPSSVLYRGPAIAYLKLSERLLGRLASSFAVLLLTIGTLSGDAPSLAGGAAAVAIAVTSSVFARQALGFGLPLLALAWWDWRPLAVLGAGTALGLALSRERLVRGTRHTWLQCFSIYPRLTKASDHVKPALSRFIGPSELLQAARSRGSFRNAVLNREPLRSLVTYPELVVLAILLIAEGRSHAWHWAAPVVVFGVLYLLTSTQSLNHLGEAYRYLEFGLFLLAPVALARLLESWPRWGVAVLLAALATWSTLLLTRVIVPWVRALPARDALAEFLVGVGLKPGDVVFPVTMRLGADICARAEGVRSFWWQPGIVAEAIYDEFIEEYPYLKRDFGELFKRYGVTHVVCDKAALARINWSYDFSRLLRLDETDRHIAFAAASPDRFDPTTGLEARGDGAP